MNRAHLVCPNNLLGPFDVSTRRRHGYITSGSRRADLRVRRAAGIMNNGNARYRPEY